MISEGSRVLIGFNRATDAEIARSPGTYQEEPETGTLECPHLSFDPRYNEQTYMVRVDVDGWDGGRLRVIPASKLWPLTENEYITVRTKRYIESIRRDAAEIDAEDESPRNREEQIALAAQRYLGT